MKIHHNLWLQKRSAKAVVCKCLMVCEGSLFEHQHYVTGFWSEIIYIKSYHIFLCQENISLCVEQDPKTSR